MAKTAIYTVVTDGGQDEYDATDAYDAVRQWAEEYRPSGKQSVNDVEAYIRRVGGFMLVHHERDGLVLTLVPQ